MKKGRDQFSLLEYLHRLEKKTKPQFSFKSQSLKKGKLWQKRLRGKLIELLGDLPREKIPLGPRIVERVKEDGYYREKIVFDGEQGFSIPAYVLVPEEKAKRKMKALLCLHGHGRGKKDVAGVVASNIEKQQYIRPLNYDYGVQFVKKGYFVLAPDARCFGELSDLSCTWGFVSSLLLGKTMVGMRAWDAMRAIDYLQTRKEVDPDRIGAVGFSWGGTHTIYASALDERIKVAVVSGYFSTLRDALIDRSCCPCQYIPNILEYADLPDIVGLISPRPLLIEYGLQDPLYTEGVVRKCYQKLENIYKVLQHPEHLDIDIFEGSHMFSGKKAFVWFDRWL